MFVNLYDDKVIMVKDAKDVEGTLIVSGSANGRPHQRWSILYVKDKKKDTRKQKPFVKELSVYSPSGKETWLLWLLMQQRKEWSWLFRIKLV